MSAVAHGRPADLVAGATTIASPPQIYERLMTVINHPRSGSADIAAVIAEDQGLTARLLKIVNSAFFSFPRRIETVTTAVTIVGTGQIRDLALATSVMTLFQDVPADLVDMESFWFHSLACGTVARVMASHRRENNVERFFVSGLLHDIGRLIIYMEAGNAARDAIERCRVTGEPLHACESEVFGFEHAQVGGALLGQWAFPASFREAVAYHHRPRRASRFPVETAAVHVADVIANAMRWGCSGEPRVPPLDPDAWSRLGIDVGLLPIILEDAERQLEAAVHFTSDGGRG